MLTSRERLTRLFDKKDIDRVPVWLLAPYHRISCYADIYNNFYYKKIVSYIEKYCDTFDRRSYGKGFCYNGNPDIKKAKYTVNEGGVRVTYDTVSYGEHVFTHTVRQGEFNTEIIHRVSDADRLEEILSIPYVPVIPDISAYEAEKAELGDRGLMMIDIGDPLGPLYHLMSAEDFAVCTLTDYDRLLGFIDVMYERVIAFYKYFLDHNIGEVFFIVGSEFAGPPLVSPDKFNEMSARYVKGICDLIRSYGKKSIVHYHGNLLHVLPGMREIGADGLHTIEAPPIGNCTITEAREALGDMILIGNVQYDDLVHLTPEAIDAEVKSVIAEGAGGRFILSPTAGPYEKVLTERTIENYLAFVDAGIRYGKM
jgi:uroporphyrinogen-III decarboxylase